MNNFEKKPNPQENFMQYTKDILGPFLKEKIEKALDTDSISGTISGWVKTVPTTDFEISFDSNKKDLEASVYNLLKENFSKMDLDLSTKFETLRSNVYIAGESEKEKPMEERKSGGGLRTLVYEGKIYEQ